MKFLIINTIQLVGSSPLLGRSRPVRLAAYRRRTTPHHYDRLHPLQEAVFDEFGRLTARLFNLPISLIACVDADGVESKANQGPPGLLSQPRVEAPCSVAVSQRKAVVLADLLSEALHLTTEAATAAQAKSLRCCAGVPRRLPDGRDIDALCVPGHQPRPFYKVA